MTQDQLGNGVKALYTYDNANRLTKLENRKSDNTLINSFEYLLDAVGNRTRMTEADGDYTAYGYDNVYQLLSEVKKNLPGSTLYSYTYTYDNVGNRLTMTQDGQLTQYAYDSNNRLLTGGTVSFGYDANGNMISQTEGGQTTQYQYSDENQLAKTIYPNGSKNWFTYDGGGIRYSKRDSTGSVRFVYDGMDVLQEVSNVTGLTVAHYLQGFGELLKQRRNNLDRWYLFDGLGSTRALADSSQGVTDTYSYDAFGNTLASTGSNVNPFQYVGSWGYYADGESNLMLLTLRYYTPSIGRFMTRDPIAESVNLYSYVRNNPVNWMDPSGLQAQAIAMAQPIAAQAQPIANVSRALVGTGIAIEGFLPFPDPTDAIGVALIGAGAILGVGLAVASIIEARRTTTLKEGRKDKWTCRAQCNVQAIGDACCPDRVYGMGSGPNQDTACRNAKRAATQSTPRGCYPRHCKCTCWKN